MRPLSAFVRRCLALCGLSLAVAALIMVPAANASPFRVFSPESKPFGKTYGEWSAEWWKQAVRQTGALGTPFAAGEVDCAAMGTRDVVFLVGTTNGTGSPVQRDCVVSKHAAILLPPINGECSEAENNGSTDAELRPCAAELADEFTNVRVSIDGTALTGLDSFRFASPLFRFSPVAGNVFDPFPPAAVNSPSVADGYWVMIDKLKKGTHTVSFGGDAPAFGFTTETTYLLTVR
jgi:hypothetical protein